MIKETKMLLTGKNAGANMSVSGKARIISDNFSEEIEKGDVIFFTSGGLGSEDLLQIYRWIRNGAVGIVSEEGSRTSHGVIAAKELGIPFIIGVKDIRNAIADGQLVLLWGNEVYSGDSFHLDISNKTIESEKIDTKSKVKINLGFPEVVEKFPYIADVADGVGFMRFEFVLLDILNGIHPLEYVEDNTPEKFAVEIADRIRPVVESFAQRRKQVWIRTDDFSPELLIKFKGGAQIETHEQNPMLGWRGIKRSIDQKDMVLPQFMAIKSLVDEGFENIGLFPPMTRKLGEYVEWKKIAYSIGLTDRDIKFGLMVEVPSAALTIESFIEFGIDFMILGTNDLTQFTLALDRTNKRLEEDFDELHPAVLRLMELVIKTCNEYGIESSIGGEAGSNPNIIKILLDMGITGVSVNPDMKTIMNTKKFIKQLEMQQ